MGVILDSSVIIDAERKHETTGELLDRVLRITGDQDAAISAIGLTELVHGVYRTPPENRERAASFLGELLSALVVFPFTTETAFLAGRIDAEQRSSGVVIPFSDLLIGATALSLGYSVLTLNIRDFQRIPGLKVVRLAP